MNLMLTVLMEKATRKTSASLPPPQTDKDETLPPACRRQRPEAEPADGRQLPEDRRRGDGRRRGLRRRPLRPRGRRTGAPHPLRHRLGGLQAPRRRRGQEMPGLPEPVPRDHAQAATIRQRSAGLRHQPAGCPNPVPAPGRRAGAGDLRAQALRGHLPPLRQPPSRPPLPRFRSGRRTNFGHVA